MADRESQANRESLYAAARVAAKIQLEDEGKEVNDALIDARAAQIISAGDQAGKKNEED